MNTTLHADNFKCYQEISATAPKQMGVVKMKGGYTISVSSATLIQVTFALALLFLSLY
jgi:NAD(P)H-nitrite reductase large subunit